MRFGSDVGVEDDETDPGVCICGACTERARQDARIAELVGRHRITQIMTVEDPAKPIIVVFISRDGHEGMLKGRGVTQLLAIEEALTAHGVSL